MTCTSDYIKLYKDKFGVQLATHPLSSREDGRRPSNAHPEYTTLPQAARVVLHVIDPYLDKGYPVYTDCYYTSLPLARARHERSTLFKGTRLRNRVGPPQQIRG